MKTATVKNAFYTGTKTAKRKIVLWKQAAPQRNIETIKMDLRNATDDKLDLQTLLNRPLTAEQTARVIDMMNEVNTRIDTYTKELNNHNLFIAI